jgi:hypothetical protein
VVDAVNSLTLVVTGQVFNTSGMAHGGPLTINPHVIDG